jgi:hypothetical protein
MDCPTTSMPDAELHLLLSHRRPPFCVELHYIIHPYFTPIKQQGQGRDTTFSLGLNPPSFSVNRKRLWALHSKALRPRKNELNIFALLSSLSLTLLSHSPRSSSSSSLSKSFCHHLLLRSPYVEPRQRHHRCHQLSNACTWDTSQRCPSSHHRHHSRHCHCSYKRCRHSTVDSTHPDCRK